MGKRKKIVRERERERERENRRGREIARIDMRLREERCDRERGGSQIRKKEKEH